MAMAKKNRPAAPKAEPQDKPATLKDLLNPEILQKLKAQAENLKAQERKAEEERRQREEEARLAEKKRLENDFEHLLGQSDPNWRKFK